MLEKLLDDRQAGETEKQRRRRKRDQKIVKRPRLTEEKWEEEWETIPYEDLVE